MWESQVSERGQRRKATKRENKAYKATKEENNAYISVSYFWRMEATCQSDNHASVLTKVTDYDNDYYHGDARSQDMNEHETGM